MIRVVDAEYNHVRNMFNRIRTIDQHEAYLAYGLPINQGLMYSWLKSRKNWALLDDHDNTVAVFGVADSLYSSGEGSPWAIGTDDVELYPLQIAKLSRTCVKEMTRMYTFLSNYVYENNITSKRWLEWCGFTLEEPAPFGLHGANFHRFYMKGEDSCVSQQS